MSSAVRCNACLAIFIAEVDEDDLDMLRCPACPRPARDESFSLRSDVDSWSDAVALYAREEREATPPAAPEPKP